jgi:hypothetical protein
MDLRAARLYLFIVAPSSRTQFRAARAQEETDDDTDLGRNDCVGDIRADRAAGAGPEHWGVRHYPDEAPAQGSRRRQRRLGNSDKLAQGGSVAWKKVLGPLKAGAHATVVLPRQFNCRVDLHGTFADGQSMDASDVEVCTEKTLNLTE